MPRVGGWAKAPAAGGRAGRAGAHQAGDRAGRAGGAMEPGQARGTEAQQRARRRAESREPGARRPSRDGAGGGGQAGGREELRTGGRAGPREREAHSRGGGAGAGWSGGEPGGGLREGRAVHAAVIKLGLEPDVYTGNSLAAFYSKLGLIGDAERVFDGMPVRDIVTWNSMVDGFVSNGLGALTLACFREMHEALEVQHDSVGIIAALAACCLE